MNYGMILWYVFQPWRLKNVWRAFAPGDSEPLYTLKATTAFSFKPGINIFLRSNTAQKKPDYTIEGLFLAKKCSIYFGEELVAEVCDHFPLLLLLLLLYICIYIHTVFFSFFLSLFVSISLSLSQTHIRWNQPEILLFLHKSIVFPSLVLLCLCSFQNNIEHIQIVFI